MIEIIKFVIETLQRRKLRTFLTMIGVFIGIASIVSLISLGQGLQIEIEKQFAKIGTDKILIQAKSGIAVPGGGSTTIVLTEKDI